MERNNLSTISSNQSRSEFKWGIGKKRLME